MATEKLIRIDDLWDPVLTNDAADTLREAERNPAPLQPGNIIEKAESATGLAEASEMPYHKRLESWVKEANECDDFTEWGKLHIFDTCVNFLSTRMKFNKIINDHPEILNEKILEPIIIVGPPRSGTTHLVNLIAVDDRLRYLPEWELRDPIPNSNQIRSSVDLNRRIQKTENSITQRAKLLPLVDVIHPVGPKTAVEEIMLQGCDFASSVWELLAPHRSWSRHFPRDDQRDHYVFMRDMLKVLQWIRGPRRWVLKSPEHLAYLDDLVSVFPDALIIITHRDPVAVCQSAATMQAYTDRLRFKSINKQETIERSIRHTKILLEREMKFRQQPIDSAIIDINFHDFIRNKWATISRIYETSGLTLDGTLIRNMERHANEDSIRKGRRISYDFRSTFSLDPAELRSEFEFYLAEHPVNIEIE